MFICALYWQNLNKSKEFLHLLNLKYDNAVKTYFVRLFTLKLEAHSIFYSVVLQKFVAFICF